MKLGYADAGANGRAEARRRGDRQILHAAHERREPSGGRAHPVAVPALAALCEHRAEQAAVARFHLVHLRKRGAQREQARVAREDSRDHRADEHLRGFAADVAFGETEDALVVARRTRRERLREDAQLGGEREQRRGQEISGQQRHFVKAAAAEDVAAARVVITSHQTRRESQRVHEFQRRRRVVEKPVWSRFAQIAVDDVRSDVAADALAALEDDDVGGGGLRAHRVRDGQARDAASDDGDARAGHTAAPAGMRSQCSHASQAHPESRWWRSTSAASASMNRGDVLSDSVR